MALALSTRAWLLRRRLYAVVTVVLASCANPPPKAPPPITPLPSPVLLDGATITDASPTVAAAILVPSVTAIDCEKIGRAYGIASGNDMSIAFHLTRHSEKFDLGKADENRAQEAAFLAKMITQHCNKGIVGMPLSSDVVACAEKASSISAFDSCFKSPPEAVAVRTKMTSLGDGRITDADLDLAIARAIGGVADSGDNTCIAPFGKVLQVGDDELLLKATNRDLRLPPLVERRVVALMGWAPTDRTWPYVKSAVLRAEKNPWILGAATYALVKGWASTREKEVSSLLIALLSNRVAEVRVHAATALGRLQTRTTRLALQRRARIESHEVVKEAIAGALATPPAAGSCPDD